MLCNLEGIDLKILQKLVNRFENIIIKLPIFFSGIRYVHIQIKTGLVYILRHFTVTTDYDRTEKVKYIKSPIQIRPININFKFVPRSGNKV